MRWRIDCIGKVRRYRAELPGKRLIAERDRRGWKCRLLRLDGGIAVLLAMVQHQPSRKAAAAAVLRTGTVPDVMAALDKLPDYLSAEQRTVTGTVVARSYRTGRGEVDTFDEIENPEPKRAPKSKEKKHAVIRQDWEESERGWGVRPDGYSLHLTLEDRDKYVEQFWAEEKKRNPSGATPDEYTRESGNPRTVMVSAEEFAELNKPKAKKLHGVWNR